ncbi:hypothetical protein F3Y22_tig00004355pilonHSYRG00055 [Hibiscus syriacus]|uniref:pectinesterase n=1 Tax=Hibiscus syriacus TaxID=106335 RepID=A0A6A3CGH2_HIBSY|nr:hypothetical protein F3Y22_tig00004355pilonHSYRG00055 [Hibiscus syriacus]
MGTGSSDQCGQGLVLSMRICKCARYVDRFRTTSLLRELLYRRRRYGAMADQFTIIIRRRGWLYHRSARDSTADNSGLVFKHGLIFGTGSAYLGRAYRPYARVLFHNTKMSDVIVPQGWSAWDYVGKENAIVSAEVDYKGPGADKSKRVPWEKNLRINIVVMETSGCKMGRSQHNLSEGKGTRTHKGNVGRDMFGAMFDGGEMDLQVTLGFSTKWDQLGPGFLNFHAKLGDINEAGWHACEDELCEEHVDIFGAFEIIEA